ncbi:PDCD5-related protein, partial [Trichophaea hybrida]
DLAKIRAARLQELQSSSSGNNSNSKDNAAQEAESRKSVIAQICTPEAVDRLGRIAMVKADRAQDLENRLIMLARTNQLRQRVTDEELVKLIGMVDESRKEKGGGEGEIVFQRRRAAIDDEDD